MDKGEKEKKIAEIREALEKATPGPWEYEMWEGYADVYPTTGRHVPICQLWTKTEEPMENAENNAHLIANAPEWLGFLLDELERLEREYAEEREKMIKALKFYANEDNWRSTRFVVGRAEADSGQTAQDVLKKIGVVMVR